MICGSERKIQTINRITTNTIKEWRLQPAIPLYYTVWKCEYADIQKFKSSRHHHGKSKYRPTFREEEKNDWKKNRWTITNRGPMFLFSQKLRESNGWKSKRGYTRGETNKNEIASKIPIRTHTKEGIERKWKTKWNDRKNEKNKEIKMVVELKKGSITHEPLKAYTSCDLIWCYVMCV